MDEMRYFLRYLLDHKNNPKLPQPHNELTCQECRILLRVFQFLQHEVFQSIIYEGTRTDPEITPGQVASLRVEAERTIARHKLTQWMDERGIKGK